MKVKRRTETTIEAHEVWVVRRSRQGSLAWCSECATHVPMLTPDDAAKLTKVTPRTIYQWVEAGRIHFSEMGIGGLRICLASLPLEGTVQPSRRGGPPAPG